MSSRTSNPSSSRHLDVEEEEIGLLLGDGFHGFEAVGALGEDRHVRVRGEELAHERARELLVVYDHGPERAGGHGPRIAPRGATHMSKVRVNAFGIAIDGYGAGSEQDLNNPMGVGGMALHQWVFGTKTFQKMAPDFAGSLIGDEVAREGVDDDFAARGFENIGAWIMGRNMFGPVRGPWSDDSWKGWWGKNPPYHVPVFVLTHHARAPITMEGGTTFSFVTDGIHAALSARRRRPRARMSDSAVALPPFASTSPPG